MRRLAPRTEIQTEASEFPPPRGRGGGSSLSNENGETELQIMVRLKYAARQVEERCCAFYQQRIKPVLQQIRLMQAAKSCCKK